MAASRKEKRTIMETTGARLKYALAVSGWSRTALARVSGVRPEAIGRLEGGKRMPELKALQALATTLGVSAGWFVFGEGAVPAIPVAAPDCRDQRRTLTPPRDGLLLLEGGGDVDSGADVPDSDPDSSPL